jgi:chemotaxis protein CheC
MGIESKITSIHLDILREIGNIGAGHAATALSKLLNRKIDMKVPSVKMTSFDEMMELAGGAEKLVASVFLRIEGDAPGNMFFIVSIEQGEDLIRRMTGETAFSFASPPFSETGLSALQELGNILSGSYLTALADFTQLNIYPSVPAISIDMAGAVISYGLLEISQSSDCAIVIDTVLMDDLKQTSGINGHFFLIPDSESFHTLFDILGVKLDV